MTSSWFGEDAADGAEIRSIGTSTVSTRTGSGAYRLIGRDESGRILFAAGFEAYAYADGPGGDERLFMVSVTMDEADAAAVATVEVEHLGEVLTTRAVSE